MKFGAYTIIKKLGAGGMGAVYEATHTDLHKRVAIKTLLPSLTESADIRTRFVREGQAAARIRHQHVVDIYDVGMLDGISYLVMEYLEGENLGDYLRIKGQTTMEEVLDIMLPVCSAIQAAHEAGIVHRDLKPANIFITRTRTGDLYPKVLDFGISKIVTDRLGETLTNAGEILGTPFYMSPEQASGERQLDARSDQYSLGIILYQYMTGRKPFDGNSMYNVLHRIVQGTFEPPRTVKADLPEGMEQAILRAMARNPDDRFPTVRELGSALLPFARPRTQAVWESEFASTQTMNGVPPRAPSSGPKPRPPSAVNLVAEPRAFVDEPSSVFAPTLSRSASSIPKEPPARSHAKLAAGAAGLLVVASVGFFVIRGREAQSSSVEALVTTPAPETPKVYRVVLEAEPATALIEIDGQPVGRGRLDKELPRDGREHELKVTAEGHEPYVVRFVDAAPSSKVVLTPVPVAAQAQSPRVKREPPIRSAPDVKPARPAGRPEADAVQKGANNALILQ